MTGKYYNGGSTSCPASPTMTTRYTYDTGANGNGRRTSMTDASGSTQWLYDNRGRMTTETKTVTGSGTFLTNGPTIPRTGS